MGSTYSKRKSPCRCRTAQGPRERYDLVQRRRQVFIYGDLRREPDIKVASILLATAHREGRLRELIERILYPSGGHDPMDPGRTAEERALVAYLRKVDRCADIRPVPRGDYIQLCRSGDV